MITFTRPVPSKPGGPWGSLTHTVCSKLADLKPGEMIEASGFTSLDRFRRVVLTASKRNNIKVVTRKNTAGNLEIYRIS